jgi:hypothetical protein
VTRMTFANAQAHGAATQLQTASRASPRIARMANDDDA